MPFSSLGLFGLHSFRSVGPTSVAHTGVNDGLFKRHGRCPSEELNMVRSKQFNCFAVSILELTTIILFVFSLSVSQGV